MHEIKTFFDILISGVTCDAIGDPEHGSLQYVGDSPQSMLNSIAVFTCDADYELDGVSDLVCLANGQWSADPPKCVSTNCEIEGTSYLFHCLKETNI